MLEKPLITIITAAYNASSEIEETMRSVLGQSYEKIEYLIIDGASKDDTVSIANRVAKDYPNRSVEIISEPDNGLYDAMNKGILKSKGQWCAFMNCGDSYNNNKTIEQIFEGIVVESKYRYLYGDSMFIQENGTETHIHSRLPQSIVYNLMACHQSIFFYVDHTSHLLYDLQYRIAADYDLTCRYSDKYGLSTFLYKPIIVARYKAYDGVSSTKENYRKGEWEHIMIKIVYGFYNFKLLKQIIRYVFHLDNV